MPIQIPKLINNEGELDSFISTPYPETIEFLKRLDGDIMIVGVGGKVGPSLAGILIKACNEAHVQKKIYGIDLFPDKAIQRSIEELGVETIPCDLLDLKSVENLPKVPNIFYLAGRKFGEVGSETLTWMINVVASENVARTFKNSRIVAFSTGCVYSLVSPESGGSTEGDKPLPVGEYANSCLGRERVFEFYAEKNFNKVLLFRLNYAVELRYGVLFDIARKVLSGEPVDRSVEMVNIIWQGDAANRAILCLEKATSPASPLNITGGELLSVTKIAETFGEIFNKPVSFSGKDTGKGYLANAAKSMEMFGPTQVNPEIILPWVAHWIKVGNKQMDKPTHFQITDGQFLD